MDPTLVHRMRGRLEADKWPRLHVLLIVGLSSGAAFLLSVSLLALHVHSMAVRYGLAGLGGYAAFLLLIRGWVQWKCSGLVSDQDVDLTQLAGQATVPWPSPSDTDVASGLFRGGRSGGGGASMAWGAPSASRGSAVGKSGGLSLDLDGDDLVWLLVALAAALAGFAAIAYVIYVAPTLLGEAALNAAVAGRVYRGLQRRETHYWTTDVVRRTGVAGAVLVFSLVLAGYALQRVAPEARSIGGVWSHLRGS